VHGDVIANELHQERLDTMEDGVHVQWPRRLVEDAGLGQDLRGQFRAAVSRFLDCTQVFGPGMGLVGHRLETMGMRTDDEQQIAEVVSRPCNEPRRRFCSDGD
jgi:hypothetical protein